MADNYGVNDGSNMAGALASIRNVFGGGQQPAPVSPDDEMRRKLRLMALQKMQAQPAPSEMNINQDRAAQLMQAFANKR